MRAMVAQLKSESEDLQQVIASVLRNLSWRADVNSKKTLREVGSVRALMGCALEVQKVKSPKVQNGIIIRLGLNLRFTVNFPFFFFCSGIDAEVRTECSLELIGTLH